MAPEHYPIPSLPSDEQWPEIIEAAKSLLEEELQEWIDGVELRVVDLPRRERLCESTPPLSPSSLALFFGELPKTDEDPWVIKPHCIELYARNIARAAVRDGDIVGPVREGFVEKPVSGWASRWPAPFFLKTIPTRSWLVVCWKCRSRPD